jgi:hypothetical protein
MGVSLGGKMIGVADGYAVTSTGTGAGVMTCTSKEQPEIKKTTDERNAKTFFITDPLGSISFFNESAPP